MMLVMLRLILVSLGFRRTVFFFYMCVLFFVFASRRRHTRCALVTGVQTCALPISADVTFAVPLPLALERMVEPFGAEGRVVRDEKEHRLLQPVHFISAGTRKPLPILLECLRVFDLARGSRALAQIGRASWTERGWQYVSNSVVAVAFKKKKTEYKQ